MQALGWPHGALVDTHLPTTVSQLENGDARRYHERLVGTSVSEGATATEARLVVPDVPEDSGKLYARIAFCQHSGDDHLTDDAMRAEGGGFWNIPSYSSHQLSCFAPWGDFLDRAIAM
jgi:hypothetical protein